jgi:hypothetical protein
MSYVKMQKTYDLDRTFTLKTVKNAIIASTSDCYGTPWIPMAKTHHITFIGQPIVASITGIITMYIYQAINTAGGGTPKVVPAKTVTWSTGTGEGGEIKILECESAELDVANGFDHVAVRAVTLSSSDSFIVHAILGPNRYGPASLI